MALQLGIVLTTIFVVGVVAIQMQKAQIRDSYEHQMIGVARSVATLPAIIDAYDDPDPSEAIQPIAELIRAASGVTYVVVTDAQGVRYSHPDPQRIGHRVSTDPSDALAGATYVGTQTGTLGTSWRVKLPIRAENGDIIGMASVGTLEAALREDLVDDLPELLGWLLGAAVIGTLAAAGATRLVWRRVFHMEPEQIAALRETRDAMLHGLGEGMVAVDDREHIALINDEAKRLLAVNDEVIGQPAEQVLDPVILRVLRRGDDSRDELVLVAEQVLYARRSSARVGGRQVGAVLILRDRTEVHALVRDRDGAHDLTQALRAQAHEFANRMHVVSGLIELGQAQDALAFINRASSGGSLGGQATAPGLRDPDVAALLLAKTSTAAELGIRLELDPAAQVTADGTTDTVTVLGNLIDNAVAATGTGGRILVSLEQDDGTTIIRVSDDGPGVPPADREHIFDVGVSGRHGPEDRGRGIGLSLVARIVQRRRGTVTVGDAPGGGAVFDVTLPSCAVTERSDRHGEVRSG